MKRLAIVAVTLLMLSAASLWLVAGDTVQGKPGGPGSSDAAGKVVARGASIDVLTSSSSRSKIELLRVSGKYTSTTDLMIQATLECALFTKVKGTVPSGEEVAAAEVRVWAEIDGTPVKVHDGDTTDPGKVVFCNRALGIETRNIGKHNPVEEAFIEIFIASRTANAFNWVALDVGQYGTDDTHEIVLYADLLLNDPKICAPFGTGTGGDCEPAPVGEAEAGVGKRMLIVEPTKMATGTTNP